ncbi:PPOX class F420-dependent oxidoreductase [Actinomadura kijaniata]|uniref:PPOX class F420-dependent oxidoreductase n=1 Tax=Actinomadura kijaniata TaxID=46161 RepID=UPI003F1C589A
MPFTEKEVAFLNSQELGRLATVGPSGAPHNVPVGFRLDAGLGTVEVTGRDLAGSLKFRHVQGDPRVALVVDDVVDPATWTVRGVEIRGTARAVPERDGPEGGPAMIRITPTRIVSWGVERHCREGYHARNVTPATGADR